MSYHTLKEAALRWIGENEHHTSGENGQESLRDIAGFLCTVSGDTKSMDICLVIQDLCGDWPAATTSELYALSRWIDQRQANKEARAGGFERTDPETRQITVRSHADRLRDRMKPIDWLIQDVLPTGGVGAIVALPGQGKTMLSLEIASCVASGDTFCGKLVKQGPVLYICPDAPASTERRLLAARAPEKIYTVNDLPDRLPTGNAQVEGALDAIREIEGEDVRLVVVDTWDACREHAGGGYSEQDAAAEKLLAWIRVICERRSLSLIVVHHSSKASPGSAKGTGVFDARLDWCALVEGEEGGLLHISTTKHREGEAGPLGSYQIKTKDLGPITVPYLVCKDASGMDPRYQQLTKFLLKNMGEKITRKRFGDEVGAVGVGFDRYLAAMRKAGVCDENKYAITQKGIQWLSGAIKLTAADFSLSG